MVETVVIKKEKKIFSKDDEIEDLFVQFEKSFDDLKHGRIRPFKH
jgi:hypothetical protein